MRHLVAAFLLTATALPVTVHAADARDCRVGDVARIWGEVSIVREGNSVVPEPGEGFCTRDRIVTGPKGVAELAFPDGTRITVGRDSEFVVQRWQQRRVLSNQAAFELVRGAFRAVTGSLTQRRHRMEVRTTIATIGVRGTDFWGGMNISPDALDVVMLSGKGVYVKNDAGTVELVEAGTGTTVPAGKAPGAAKTWSPEKLQKAVGTITP